MGEALLVVDKVPGPSSFDVVRQVRTILRADKVGHAGSLDPFASGVLVLLVGKATKLSSILINADKSYRAVAKLGEATDTMDCTGTVTKQEAIPKLEASEVEKTLKSFEGTWHQTPPMYSAKKIRGVRLYQLARQNIHVRRQPIPVQLYSIELIKYEAPFIEFTVSCSKGTYIRSLADEIGTRLGTVGHLHQLQRLSCGSFSLKEGATVEQIEENLDFWREQGYRNYVRFMKKERVLRGPARHLQSPLRSGNSMVNRGQKHGQERSLEVNY